MSITFDPFMYLTLPLPVHKTWSHTVCYVPLDPAKPHVKIPVELSRDASFRDVRALLAKWTGAPAENVRLLPLPLLREYWYPPTSDYGQYSHIGERAHFSKTYSAIRVVCHACQKRGFVLQVSDTQSLQPCHASSSC